MPRIGIGFGLGLYGGSIDAQAQAHYNRVIADGGVIPAGVSGVNAFFNAVKSIYGTSDITTAVSVGLDAHYLGYKLGAGAGATSGQAVQKLYSCSGSSGDVVQTTAASQPLLLAHNGASSDNYWYGSGVAGNYVSTPSASANQITGDIEVIVKNVNVSTWLQTGTLSGKRATSNISWEAFTFSSGASGYLGFQASIDGISATNSFSAAHTFSINTNYWLKFRRVASSGVCTFFYSTDNGLNYTQLGGNVAGVAGNLYNSTTNLTIGAVNGGVANNLIGKIGGVTIANSIGGTPVVDFNPSTYNASTSQTQWTSTTGEIWTINTGTATTGYKGALVDRTIVQTDRVDDTMSVALTSTMQTSLSTNHGFGFVATRFTNTNNEFMAILGGDYASNNSIQVWFPSTTFGVDNTNTGTVSSGNISTGTYSVTKKFSYVDNIVYGGTSTKIVNATSNSGSYYNNTTNKPTITSGNLVLFQSGFGRFNGSFFTFVMAIDGTKLNQLNTALRTFNNNFAL